MDKEEAKKLAEEHWKWLEALLHKIYVDAMVHGIKHGEGGVNDTTGRGQTKRTI